MITNNINDTENDHNVNKHIDKYVKVWGGVDRRHKTVYLKMYLASGMVLTFANLCDLTYVLQNYLCCSYREKEH